MFNPQDGGQDPSEMPPEMAEADDGMGGGYLPEPDGEMQGGSEDGPLPGEPTGSIDPGVTEVQGSAPLSNVLDCR